MGDPAKIASSKPIQVSTFHELVEITAAFSYCNKDYLLFFRGQGRDYLNKSESSTFYPSIYRGDYLPHRELIHRFDILDGASKALVDLFESRNIDGHKDIKRRKLIQWSVLQHYEVCDTPLLDFTHSLRVACSFAHLKNNADKAYVFVFGFPYLTNRISFNSEHDLVNIRLLSICPPDAKRPYFQEGYVAGTDEITYNYERKTELDFNNRLIIKYEIPLTQSFWGRGFHQIPENSLYPPNDPIMKLCAEIKDKASKELKSGDLGDFLKLWAEIEELVTTNVRDNQHRYMSFRLALGELTERNLIDKDLYYQLDRIRSFRNQVVHQPTKVTSGMISDFMYNAEQALQTLKTRI